MKILIAVPSKNRVETLKKYTWQWLKHVTTDFAIFVEPQDIDKYFYEFDNVVNIEQDNQGLSYAKKYIQDYAERMGYDLVFKIDDDIKCFTNFRKSTSPEECAEFIDDFIKGKALPMFEEKEIVGAITFPYSFEMYKETGFTLTKRIQTCYITRTEYLCSKVQLNVFEDFGVGLQIITAGKKILRYGKIGQLMGVKVGGGTGGHQDFDRSEEAMKEIDLLRTIYPPLKFRKVDKRWKIEPDIRSIKI